MIKVTIKFLNLRGIWVAKTSKILSIMSNNNKNNAEKKKNTIEQNSQHVVLSIE